MAIDRNQQELYELYCFDNAPDPLQYSRFRIVQKGKIGYANGMKEIFIPAQIQCAGPFRKCRAQVTVPCRKLPPCEHTRKQSDAWFFIDSSGHKIDSNETQNE